MSSARCSAAVMPAADVDHLVGDGCREHRVVAGHQHRRAGLAPGPHQLTDHDASVGVEPLLGLVEDEQAGRPEPGERQPEQLPLAGRQLVREALAHRAEAEGVELVLHPLGAAAGLAAPGRVDEGEVVGQGEVAVGRRGADQSRDVLAGGTAPLVGRVAVDRHGAGGRCEQAGDEAQEGGLARPVRAAHDDARPRLGDQVGGGEQGGHVEHLGHPVGHDPASGEGFCGHPGHLRVALHRSS